MTQRTCIFDLDGVVTDTAHYHFLAWQRLARSVGVDFTEEDNHALKGVGRMESLAIILDRADGHFDQQAREALAAGKNAHYKELIGGISPSDLLPGVSDAFAWLKGHRWRIGLASASRNAPAVIESLGIADVFDYVADAGSIPNGKPAPDIFLDVSKTLGVAPADCIGVEDAVSGVTAIKSAGMYAAGIGDPAVLTEADIVMPTPEGLIQQVFEKT